MQENFLEKRVVLLETRVEEMATNEVVEAVGAQILQLGAEMRAGFSALREEMRAGSSALQDETRNESSALRDEMHAGHSRLREEMSAESSALREEMRAGSSALREEMLGQSSALREEMRVQSSALRDELGNMIEQRTADILSLMSERFERTDRRVTVLHEDLVERIKAIADRPSR